MNGKIERFLKNRTVIHLDTSPILYYIQEDQHYLPVVKDVFSRIDDGFVSAISSFITLIELLVKPLQQKAYDLANKYRDLLVDSPCFTLYPVERTVSERAAELRAKYGPSLKTPDAIQIATAISFGAQVFITNDDDLKRKVKEIQVLTIKELM